MSTVALRRPAARPGLSGVAAGRCAEVSWRRLGRAAGLMATGAVLAAAAVWAVWFRPPYLGGTTSIVLVSGNSMEPGMSTGDLVVVRRAGGYRPGDVVAYRIPRGQPGTGALVIHRIIGGGEREGYLTQGDNRTFWDVWRPRPDDVLGKVWLHVPAMGRWLAVAGKPPVAGAAAGILAFLTVAAGPRRRPGA